MGDNNQIAKCSRCYVVERSRTSHQACHDGVSCTLATSLRIPCKDNLMSLASSMESGSRVCCSDDVVCQQSEDGNSCERSELRSLALSFSDPARTAYVGSWILLQSESATKRFMSRSPQHSLLSHMIRGRETHMIATERLRETRETFAGSVCGPSMTAPANHDHLFVVVHS